VGSSQRLDIVTMRSDLPDKKNLRVDRAQLGEMQQLKRLDPATSMSDPKVLEDFIYETVSSNLGDERIRFLVGGHGGAEKGLLPDGKHNNAEADQAMQVDAFAGAISKALDRVEKEKGVRPKIDNLMLVSCLMGNSSFLHALAQTGDVETVVASPELMAGSNPISTFEYLNDPKTSKANGREYAQYLVDEWSQAPAMVGGSKQHLHADTIGAYDLSPAKAKRFQKALGGFFEAALAEPKFAEYLKEGIAKAPSYGINPLVNVMFDVDNRDLLQVLESSLQDKRISSSKLKEAMAELKVATEAQVIDQKVSAKYEGRKGPSLYLPLDRWDLNEKMTGTALLKSVRYREFMEMIFDAPLHRGVVDGLINEVSRVSETGTLDKAFKKLMDAATGKKAKEADEPPKAAETKSPELPSPTDPAKQLPPEMTALAEQLVKGLIMATSPEAKELQELHKLEEPEPPTAGQKWLGRIGKLVTAGLSTAVGAAAGVIAAIPGALIGAAAGTAAGWRGVSAAGTHKPTSKEESELLSNVVDKLLKANGLANNEPEAGKASAEPDTTDQRSAEDQTKANEAPKKGKPDLSALSDLKNGRGAKILKQLILLPSEAVGLRMHQAAGHKLGELPGRLVGAVVGGLGGAVLNALATGGIAFAGAGLITFSKIGKQAKPPDKGSDLFTGRYEPKKATAETAT
jgi:hypothetical protein